MLQSCRGCDLLQKTICTYARGDFASKNFYRDWSRVLAIVREKYCGHPAASNFTIDNETIRQDARQLAKAFIE